MKEKLYNIRSVIFGHAVGDALGVPVEFTDRAERDQDPVKEMRGFGTYPFPAGTWSDDTSMVLACMDSLSNGIDYDDMMSKFCLWLNESKYTPSDQIFDIGVSTRKSLMLYSSFGEAPLVCGQRSEWDNGNGSLMRMSPIILYFYHSKFKGIYLEEKIKYIEDVSALTHGHERSFVGCGIYYFIMTELLKNPCKESLYTGIEKAREYYSDHPEVKHYSRILDNKIEELPRNEISGNGYVVSCLEAAIWCLLNSESYAECVLKAVNLGDDTDTTAAVAGGLAGVLYGYDNIPEEWINTIIRKDYIDDFCVKAAEKW